MKTLYISALTDISIEGSFGARLKLSDSMFLTNDRAHVESLLGKHFETIAGSLETDFLRNAGAVVYEVTEHSQPFTSNQQAVTFLNGQIGQTRLFLLALWLVKDNSVNCEMGFLEHPYRDSYVSGISSSSHSMHFVGAACKASQTIFTADELRRARHIYNAVFPRSGAATSRFEHFPVLPVDLRRVERLLYFLQAARCGPEAGVKVSSYITCLECLFTTDASELAHKLSERVAVFLGRSAEERLTIYRDLKEAYNLRSKTVHGDRISGKLSKSALAIVKKCDDYLRRTLLKILLSPQMTALFDGPSDALEDHFLSLQFGINAISRSQGSPGD